MKQEDPAARLESPGFSRGEEVNDAAETTDRDTAVDLSPAARRLLAAVSACLGVVVLAPIALSNQDLYRWARSPRGLDLSPLFAVAVPVALDIAAVACIGMVIIGAVWRRERPGIFGLLVWVFAGVSVVGQYRHGIAQRETGGAQDAWWLFPLLAVLGPALVEATLHRIRRWARQDAGEQHRGAAGFGSRWLPGVAFRETLAAWAASRREGIGDWRQAVAYVRERTAVKRLPPADSLRYALAALATADPHAARVWLQARGVLVDQAVVDDVTGQPAAQTIQTAAPARPRIQTTVQTGGWPIIPMRADRLPIIPATPPLTEAVEDSTRPAIAQRQVPAQTVRPATPAAVQTGETEAETETETGSVASVIAVIDEKLLPYLGHVMTAHPDWATGIMLTRDPAALTYAKIKAACGITGQQTTREIRTALLMLAHAPDEAAAAVRAAAQTATTAI